MSRRIAAAARHESNNIKTSRSKNTNLLPNIVGAIPAPNLIWSLGAMRYSIPVINDLVDDVEVARLPYEPLRYA